MIESGLLAALAATSRALPCAERRTGVPLALATLDAAPTMALAYVWMHFEHDPMDGREVGAAASGVSVLSHAKCPNDRHHVTENEDNGLLWLPVVPQGELLTQP